MSYRDEHGDIILTKEEQKDLYYRLTHPDAEALALRDKFLEDFNKKFTTKFNADGSIECFENIDYANPGPVDDTQDMPSLDTRKLLQDWQAMVQDRTQEHTRPLLDILEALGVELTDDVRIWAANKVGWISDVDYPDFEKNTDNTFTVTFRGMDGIDNH